MKNSVRLLSLLVLAFLFSLAPANAIEVTEPADREFELYYANVFSVFANASVSGGKISASGYLEAKATTDYVTATITLKKKANGTWSTVDSWNASGYKFAAPTGSKAVSSGTYKVFLTGTVKRGTFIENVSAESYEVQV